MTGMNLNELLNGDGGPRWQQRVRDFCERVQARHQAIYDRALAELPDYRLREEVYPTVLQKMLIRGDGRKIFRLELGQGADARTYGTLHAFSDGTWAAEGSGTSVLNPPRSTEREAVADAITEYLISCGRI